MFTAVKDGSTFCGAWVKFSSVAVRVKAAETSTEH